MPYWLITTGEGAGIDGGMMQRNGPDHPVTNVIDVQSIDDMIPRIEGAGGNVVVPKMPIPGVGYVAYFKDLDGHIVGLHQHDPSAA